MRDDTRASSSLSIGSRQEQRRTLLGQVVVDASSTAGAPVDDEATDIVPPGSYEADPQPKSFVQGAKSWATEVQQKTFLKEEELAQLEQTRPGLVVWLRSSAGFIAQIALFGLFVGIDAGKSLFVSKALKGTSVISSSIVVMVSFVSIIIGVLLAFGIDGAAGVGMAFDISAIKKFSVVAALFAMAQCFNTMSYSLLSPGMVKIFGQVRLLQTAVLSAIFLKRRYIGAQWSAMLIVVLGAFLYTQAKEEDEAAFRLNKLVNQHMTNTKACDNELWTIANSSKELAKPPGSCAVLPDSPPSQVADQMAKGLLYVFIYLFLSDVGSIMSEKFLKDSAGVPFYVQKVAIELMGFPVAFLMSIVTPIFFENGKGMWWSGTHDEPPKSGNKVGNWFFQGWGNEAFLALAFNIGGSWLSGIIVKRMSSVMKLLGKVMSVAVVYFLGDCWLTKQNGRTPPLMCTVALFVVMSATYTFLTVPSPKAEKKPPPPPPPPPTKPREVEMAN